MGFDTSVPADFIADVWGQVTSATCAAEDTNNNGVWDAGEDINGNGLNDPNIPSLSTQELITDVNGFGYFTITYPKAQGTWVDIELSASISGGLPENQDSQAFTLNVLKSETEDIGVFHAFLTSPYGTAGTCIDPT